MALEVVILSEGVTDIVMDIMAVMPPGIYMVAAIRGSMV
jgi:hypothetical protein